jgi:hypothetical protein
MMPFCARERETEPTPPGLCQARFQSRRMRRSYSRNLSAFAADREKPTDGGLFLLDWRLVPEAGIEPARVLPRGILSPVRLW